nr:branched-chain amino acid ABC transporter permease [Pseudomonas sp.]
MADKTYVKAGLAVGLVTLAAAFMPIGYNANLVTTIAIAALIAASLRFVLLIGELNFGTAAFVGIGAYSAGVATTIYQLPFSAALLLGGLLATLAGLVFGYVTLKTKGPYFLLIGFAFTEVVRIVYTKANWLGGNSGMVGIFPPRAVEDHYTAFAVFIVGVLLIALYAIERSHLGKCFIAIRDNDSVVQSVGINVHMTKVACLCIGAFCAGMAGGLMAFVNNVISPNDFGFLLSTFALAYLKVGGEDSPVGPIAGSILLVLISSVALGMGGGEHVFYGLAIVLSVLLMPKGIVGLFEGMRRRVASRRAMRERLT